MLNYQTVDFMAGQLADQYATQRQAGYSYKNEEDLPKFFRAQAAKLAANGVSSIYDVQQADGGIVNAATGEPIKDVVLRPTWETDPEAYKFRGPVELEERGKFTRWGKDLSVDGQADYGISFESGVPVYTPFWKDTATKILGMDLEDAVKVAIAVTAAYYGGSYLMGGEAAAGSAAAGTGGAAGTGLTAGAGGSTGLTLGTTSAGIGGGAIGTGLTAPAGFTLAPGVGASLAAGGAGLSLLEGAQFPVEGLQATASNVPSTAAPFATTTAAEGLAIPTTPGLSAMGGAQGLTVPVAGGTISQLGLVPTGAVPALGTDGFFSTSLVNDPNVLGNAVFSTDALAVPAVAGGGIGAMSALQAAGALGSLLGQPALPLVSGGGGGGGQTRGVDFSPLYQNTMVGLLPLAERYRRSLI
jgi:hypothetical protein